MKSFYFNLYKHTDSLPAGTAYTSPQMIFHQTDVLQWKNENENSLIFVFLHYTLVVILRRNNGLLFKEHCRIYCIMTHPQDMCCVMS